MNSLKTGKKEGFKGEWIVVLPTESFGKYLNNPQVKRLYLTDVGYFPNAKSHYRERNKGIQENIYFYCLNGEGYIEINNKKIILKENDAFVIPSNTPHKYYASDKNPWSILWVHFKGDDCKYYPLNDLKVMHFDSKTSSERMIYFFNLLLHRLRQNYTLENFIYISNVLAVILSETYHKINQNESSKLQTLITNITRYMSLNLNKELTLLSISEEFDVSPSYISNIFKENTGHSPIDFFIHMKIYKAINLLSSSNLRIYQIASEVGYKDQYYFSRVFKKITGVSPKKYIKNRN